MNRPPFRIAAAAIALALPAAALAHHGWGWTEDRETRLSGEIVSISFGNPHMHIKVRASKGVWSVDLSPPSIARRSGFGPGSVKEGDMVVLTGHRARDQSVLAFKAETVTVNGRTWDVYPQRPKTLDPGS